MSYVVASFIYKTKIRSDLDWTMDGLTCTKEGIRRPCVELRGEYDSSISRGIIQVYNAGISRQLIPSCRGDGFYGTRACLPLPVTMALKFVGHWKPILKILCISISDWIGKKKLGHCSPHKSRCWISRLVGIGNWPNGPQSMVHRNGGLAS